MLLKDLFKSQLPKTLTEYQLGTELYWWLRRFPPEVERVEQLMALAVIPIVADESESWLAAQSQHLRVTIADAAKALDSVRSTPALRLDVLARTLREHDAEEDPSYSFGAFQAQLKETVAERVCVRRDRKSVV